VEVEGRSTDKTIFFHSIFEMGMDGFRFFVWLVISDCGPRNSALFKNRIAFPSRTGHPRRPNRLLPKRLWVRGPGQLFHSVCPLFPGGGSETAPNPLPGRHTAWNSYPGPRKSTVFPRRFLLETSFPSALWRKDAMHRKVYFAERRAVRFIAGTHTPNET
jgi:hypothetical protein